MAGGRSSEVGLANALPEVASWKDTMTANGTLPSEEADKDACCLAFKEHNYMLGLALPEPCPSYTLAADPSSVGLASLLGCTEAQGHFELVRPFWLTD